jgi:glycosyltransferase involved in cell wall biosynthesis
MNPIPFGKTPLPPQAPQTLPTLRTAQTPPASQQARAPSAHTAAPRCRVSVVIKALNEERRIEATVESALRAVAAVGGEVILADSYSSDRTVELASAYPIRIVQLANPEERCCGAGPQLGYQHSRGEFVYILDGDMQMREGFLEQALAFLDTHADVAGVGGRVVEQNTESLEYMSRGERASPHLQPGHVDRLDGGGLYRRSAIEAAGYFSDRNLHSYEEFDLAIRLRALGWRLWRLPVDAANHWGHDAPPYRLLMRRWRTHYICGLGELVRAAVGQPRLPLALRGLRELRLYIAVLGWWAVLASVTLWPMTAPWRLALFCAIAGAPVLLMTWRKRSAAKALYAVVSWCFNAAGLLRGLLRPQRPAREAIASRVLKEPAQEAIH